ncbi:MAG: UDP-3-O-[3-hydroxymyristoyl] N-acetylglucosamine deacetylase [Limisphaerales bacterium]
MRQQQQTLKESVSFTGIGLHSGNPVNMTFVPAPINTGILFRRVDLDGQPEVPALVEHVVDTNRSTTLGKGNIRLHTVEHILAAFSGCGVDNAIVEVDANEPPIADGSSRQYVKMIDQAGLEPQAEPRDYFKIEEPFEFTVGETSMSVFPHDKLKITCTSAGASGRMTEFFEVEITPESWAQELAHARTFCFFEEIEYLYKNGLIRGGSLENAVVIRDDAILTNEPLRYNEEFVRHKMLDILGDVSLLGKPLLAHITAVRPSHAANAELTRQLSALMRKPQEKVDTFSPPPSAKPKPATTPEPVAVESPIQDGMTLNIDQIMKILPHRYPFLFVDKITLIDGNKITGEKMVTINEPFFQGHFPDHPIMPGVLQLEAIAQVAGILMLKQAENFGKLAYFMSAEKVKWRKPVRPGTTLQISVELLKNRRGIGKAKGVCTVNGEEVSQASVTFMLIDR